MKIIYITNARIPTEKAHGYQICKMSEEFGNLGVEVELWISSRANSIKEEVFSFYGLKNNFKIKKIKSFDFHRYHRYLGKLSFRLHSFWFAYKLLFKKIDRKAIIYTRDVEIGWLLSLRGYQTVMESHNWPNRDWLFRRILKGCDRVIVISHGLKEVFLREGWPEDKILLAPDGVDLEKFGVKIGSAEARQKLNLPLDKKIVLYGGHLYSWKGADILAKAADYLKDCLLVFVGGTEVDRKNFEKEYGASANIKIFPFQKKDFMPLYFRAADVLILPNKRGEKISEKYTSPLKLFEYMASGRPIVASALPSIREVLNENNAVLVEPGDPDALSRGVKKLIGDTAWSAKLAGQALSEVQKFSWQKRAENILNFINS